MLLVLLVLQSSTGGTHFTVNNRYPFVRIQTMTTRTARRRFRRQTAEDSLQLITAEESKEVITAHVFTISVGPVTCELSAVDGIIRHVVGYVFGIIVCVDPGWVVAHRYVGGRGYNVINVACA